MPVRCPLCGGAWKVWGLSGGLLFGTLLGPEATGTGSLGRCLFVSGFLRSPGPGHGFVRGAGMGATGLLFENYIVDASIL